MDRVQWGKKVTDELNKLASDKQAIKSWVERQNFKVISLQEKSDGSWFEAENNNMFFTTLRVRWNVNESLLSR
jgi:hypothetical protein